MRFPFTFKQPSHRFPIPPRDTDTVHAMLTPGEMILDDKQQSAVQPIPGREGMLRQDQLQRMKLMARGKPQHFWQGGITDPVIPGGVPGGQPMIGPRPAPTPFARPMAPAPFPAAGDTGGTPAAPMLRPQPQITRQPLQRFSGGGVASAWQPGDPWFESTGGENNPPHIYHDANGQPLLGPGGTWTPPDDLQGINNEQSGSTNFDGNNYGQMGYYNPNMYGGAMAPYDSSYPYGMPNAPGSGGPTQKFAGFMGNLVGGGLGAFIPGGSLIGSKLGGMGARAFTKWLQNQQANRQANPQYGTGGSGRDERKPQGMGLWGTNPGNNPTEVKWAGPERNFGDPISNRIDPNSPGMSGGGPLTSNPSEPGWIGGTPFGSSLGPGGLAMALPGSFSGLGRGSDGTIGWNYFGDLSRRQMMNGGDPALGFGGPGDAITQYAGFSGRNPAAGAIGAPVVNWTVQGGGGQGSRFGPNARQMNQA